MELVPTVLVAPNLAGVEPVMSIAVVEQLGVFFHRLARVPAGVDPWGMELVRTALAAPPLAGVEPVPSIAVVVVAPSRAQQHRVVAVRVAVAVRAAVEPAGVDR